MRKFLIDTDTASDDAIAILMAHHWPDVQIIAVTIVNGNVPVEQGTLNALYTINTFAKRSSEKVMLVKGILNKADQFLLP